MKRIMKVMATLAIALPVMTGCADKKDSSESNTTSTEQCTLPDEATASTDDNFNLEALNKLSSIEDLSSKDIDFILEQAGILAKKAQGMDRKEYNAFLKTLSKDDKEAVMIIAIGLAGAQKSPNLSKSQKERMEKLESQLPLK